MARVCWRSAISHRLRHVARKYGDSRPVCVCYPPKNHQTPPDGGPRGAHVKAQLDGRYACISVASCSRARARSSRVRCKSISSVLLRLAGLDVAELLVLQMAYSAKACRPGGNHTESQRYSLDSLRRGRRQVFPGSDRKCLCAIEQTPVGGVPEARGQRFYLLDCSPQRLRIVTFVMCDSEQ